MAAIIPSTQKRLICTQYTKIKIVSFFYKNNHYIKYAPTYIYYIIFATAMRFQEIVSITGLPGLFQLISTKSDGAIVRNIDDNTTKFVAARTHSVTALDGIEVYTNQDNVRLFEVFLIMKSNVAAAGELDTTKADNKAIKAHYTKLFPEHDQDRVYVSDMKKMIKWLAILDSKGLLTPAEPEAAAAIETVAPAVEAVEEPKAKKPKAIKVAKEPTADATETAAEEKPKRTRKKASEE